MNKIVKENRAQVKDRAARHGALSLYVHIFAKTTDTSWWSVLNFFTFMFCKKMNVISWLPASGSDRRRTYRKPNDP